MFLLIHFSSFQCCSWLCHWPCQKKNVYSKHNDFNTRALNFGLMMLMMCDDFYCCCCCEFSPFFCNYRIDHVIRSCKTISSFDHLQFMMLCSFWGIVGEFAGNRATDVRTYPALAYSSRSPVRKQYWRIYAYHLLSAMWFPFYDRARADECNAQLLANTIHISRNNKLCIMISRKKRMWTLNNNTKIPFGTDFAFAIRDPVLKMINTRFNQLELSHANSIYEILDVFACLRQCFKRNQKLNAAVFDDCVLISPLRLGCIHLYVHYGMEKKKWQKHDNWTAHNFIWFAYMESRQAKILL